MHQALQEENRPLNADTSSDPSVLGDMDSLCGGWVAANAMTSTQNTFLVRLDRHMEAAAHSAASPPKFGGALQ